MPPEPVWIDWLPVSLMVRNRFQPACPSLRIGPHSSTQLSESSRRPNEANRNSMRFVESVNRSIWIFYPFSLRLCITSTSSFGHLNVLPLDPLWLVLNYSSHYNLSGRSIKQEASFDIFLTKVVGISMNNFNRTVFPLPSNDCVGWQMSMLERQHAKSRSFHKTSNSL